MGGCPTRETPRVPFLRRQQQPASHPLYKQHLQSTRRNALPVKLIDGTLVMRHEHLACALVEGLGVAKVNFLAK